jgi:hypothetical protein
MAISQSDPKPLPPPGQTGVHSPRIGRARPSKRLEAGSFTLGVRPPRSSAMGLRALILCGALGAVALGGCGGSQTSSHGTTRPLTTRSSSPRAHAPAALASIRGRMLNNNELAGFTESGRVIGLTPKMWLQENQTPRNQLGSEAARLGRLGFVKGVTENLSGGSSQGTVSGLSLVEQFRTPNAARSELASEVREFRKSVTPPARYFAFPVAGIPGAQGSGTASTGMAGIYLAFAHGDYYYLVGEGGPDLGELKKAALNTAAVHLYHRVPT